MTYQPLRVLAIQHTATAGGAQRSFAALMQNLPAFGVEPFAVVLDDGPMVGWLRHGSVPHVLVPQARLREVGGVLSLVMRLRGLIREHRPDVVFANMTKAHVFGGVAARLAGRPEVWWQRGVPSPLAIERLAAYIPSDAVIASSDFALAAQGVLRPRQRLRKVHPGVDIDRIMARAGAGAAVRRQLGWEGNTVVGIVGRLSHWKGQDIFLKAARLIVDDRPDSRFLIVGGTTHGHEGTYPDDVRALAENLGLGDRVHFAGQQEDVFGWTDAMDIVVHASHSEAFGRVVVEAMALEKAVIATNLGGPSEIIDPGRSGVLVPPKDPDALARAMSGLLQDPQHRAAMARRARERSRLFDEKHSAEALAKVFRDVQRHSTSSENLSGPRTSQPV